jgi:hypothetical protein
VPTSDQDTTTTTVSRYANQRIEAMGKRIESLEGAIETTVTSLEAIDSETVGQIRFGLMAALVETFKDALLCLPETTDEQLDKWLPKIEKHESEQATAEAQP